MQNAKCKHTKAGANLSMEMYHPIKDVQFMMLRLVDSEMVYLIKHSTWVSNLVPIHKKNNDIHLCVDFQHFNRESLKDHFPLPSMEEILQTVVGSKIFYMLNGFSGYNQVLVKEEDQHKTMFTTKWGIFFDTKIPFGLSNGSHLPKRNGHSFLGADK